MSDALARTMVDPNSFATTMVVAYLDRFGMEALEWHPWTVRVEVDSEFHATIPDANFDRLMAGILLVSTDRFYKDLDAFLRVAEILSGGAMDPSTVAAPGCLECAWAITEALLLGPPEPGDDDPFVEDVRHYVGHALDREGFLRAPDVLAIGLRPDRATRAVSAHADDPGMLQAVKETEARRERVIRDSLRDGLDRLVTQVGSLELENGDASTLLARLKHDTQRG